MKNERQVAFTTSSNNIFADLGLPNPEVKRMKTKLVVAIKNAMKLQGLSQTQLAALSKPSKPFMAANSAIRGDSVLILNVQTDSPLRNLRNILLGRIFIVCYSFFYSFSENFFPHR